MSNRIETEFLDNKHLYVLTHEFYPKHGGIAVYTEEMAREAVLQGYKTEVWAPDDPLLRLKKYPFQIRALPWKGNQNWSNRWKLIRMLFREKEALQGSAIYLPEPGPILAMMYLQLSSFDFSKVGKIVMTLHGTEILEFHKTLHRKVLFQKLLDRCCKIGIVSEYNRGLLQERFKVDPKRLVVIPGALRSNFVKEKQYLDGRIPFVNEVRIAKGDEPNASRPIILMTVARIHPRKGQLEVIRALTSLSDESRRSVEYWIVGPVVNEDYFKVLEKMGKQSNIKMRFWGEVDDTELSDLYNRADIFILTSVPYKRSIEGFGLVYLEAAAHGLVIVGNRIGGVAEAVIDGKTGFLVQPGDRHQLGKILSQLIADPDMRRSLRENAKRHIQHFSWRKNLSLLLGN